MQAIIKLFFLVIFFLPNLSFSAPPPVNERIVKADERFNKVIKETPAKPVEAVVFFSNDMSLEKVRTGLSNAPFSVKGFRHGTQSYSGGYSLSYGKTVDEAVQNYQRDHLLFLQKRTEIEGDMLNTETDEKLKNHLQNIVRK